MKTLLPTPLRLAATDLNGNAVGIGLQHAGPTRSQEKKPSHGLSIERLDLRRVADRYASYAVGEHISDGLPHLRALWEHVAAVIYPEH